MNSTIPFLLTVSHSDENEYLIKKIDLSVYGSSSTDKPLESYELKRLVRAYQIHLKHNDQLPMTSDIADQSIPEDKQKLIRAYASDKPKSITTDFPLVDHETIQQDSLCFLTQPWDVFPVGTLILRRVTNFSQTLFIDPFCTLNIKTHDIELRTYESFMHQNQENQIPDFAEQARRIAEALTGKAPSPWDKIASKLLQYVWPTEDEAAKQWEMVFKRITQIVKKALAEDKVKTAIKVLRGFISFHSTQYVHLRDDPKISKKQRMAALMNYDHDFYTKIVNELSPNISDKANHEIAISALANFLLGANLHLALTQERALQDPSESHAYHKTVISLASSYSEYAASMKDVMIDYRTGMITKVKNSCNALGNYYYFNDNFTGKEVERIYFNSKNIIEMKNEIDKLRNKKIGNLYSEQAGIFRKNIHPIIKAWEKLKTNPVPDKKSLELSDQS